MSRTHSADLPPDATITLVRDASAVVRLNTTGRGGDEKLLVWIDAGAIRVVTLGDNDRRSYGSQVEGAGVRALDDGEAATSSRAHQGAALVTGPGGGRGTDDEVTADRDWFGL